VIGVVGAGTMGAGIAQLGCAAGIETRLHDPVPEALEKGAAYVRDGLGKLAAKGRLEDPERAAGLLGLAGSIEELAGCDLVVEAAPEKPELKRELFGRLSGVCGPECVLATNTSSIPVTSLAGAAERPENVVGMHFFNPPPLMKLLEVIAAEQTGDRALEIARATGDAMGKHVIVAADGPGFLVNRCGRPFGSEALRLLQERVATVEQIDRICRLGGGFKMGPFELMDLVGIDVGLAVAESFTELSFGEPRWKPHPLQAQKVAAGQLGRKSGRGWYGYGDGPHRGKDEPAPEGSVEFDGAGMVDCSDRGLSDPGDVGFHLLPGSGLVELTRGPSATERQVSDAEERAGAAGLHHEWVADAPGLVLGRIVCCLVNEAAFAIGEGVGSPEDVDSGMTLGLNHPRGPVQWSHDVGIDRVLGTIDALWSERREERYRAAPALRRAAALETAL
jgi:3-hydroxybutyryl-CoA dehydrogenase